MTVTYSYKADIDSAHAGDETIVFNPDTKQVWVEGVEVKPDLGAEGKAYLGYETADAGGTLSTGTLTFAADGKTANIAGWIYTHAIPLDPIEPITHETASKNKPQLPFSSTLVGTPST